MDIVRLVRKIALYLGLLLIALVAYVIFFETNNLHKAIISMSDLVARGNRYATQQTQDIDLVKEQITTNTASRRAYELWLNAMSSYNGLSNLHTDGATCYGTLTSVSGTDPIMSNDIVGFLREDFNSGSSYGYTPLNFGITYLDPVKLEEDMKSFLIRNIRGFSTMFSFGKYGLYVVDPNTIDVHVSLDMTPVRIDSLLTDDVSKKAFYSMFGIDAPASVSELNSNKFIQKNELKTIVMYKIKYYVKWDYVTTAYFFKMKKSETVAYLSQAVPPKGIYFPLWYDREGNLETDISKKGSSPRRKLITDEPLEYDFEYVLTH